LLASFVLGKFAHEAYEQIRRGARLIVDGYTDMDQASSVVPAK
jgi:hypothetical protein